ncbi:(Fe-S)-binding protein [Sporomusa silvacetica]|uniref:(Fe-S)-binding protein n=1 Tax=Sporomusa silvacetica TaxID=55504 RepID=UPI001FE534FE|nr:(Fe-S)-binding protein [Sporomusa silvacetica]
MNLNIGELSLELRQEYVTRNCGVSKIHKPLLDDVQNVYVATEAKTALRGSQQNEENLKGAEMIFFPGCSLSLNSPHLVKQSYTFLREQFPGIGVLTGCCGAPAHLIGEQSVSNDIFLDIIQSVRDMEAKTIIAACSSCVKLLKSKLPEDIGVVSLYQLLGEFKFSKRSKVSHVFNIHDACSSRGDDLTQAAVRKIVTGLGYTVEEIEHSKNLTQCCGRGGMAAVVDDQYSATVAKRTLNEVNQDLIVYCATCRANFSDQGTRVIHLLELLFNENWEDELTKAPLPFEETVKNLTNLKIYFEKKCYS